MQANQSYFYLIGLLVALLVACNEGQLPAPPPTPIVASMEGATGIPALTPTLTAPDTAVPIATPTLFIPDTAVPPTATPTINANGRSIGDPFTPELGNTGYDVQNYSLQLALDPAETYVRGTAIITALATAEEMETISLDFIGFEISQVTVAEVSMPFTREDGKLIVPLSQPPAVGDTFTVMVTYAGEPVQEPSPYVGFIEGLGLHFINGETIFALAEPDGARYWFPANDHPRDKAMFRFEVTVPDGLTAVANGQLIATHTEPPGAPPGQDTFIWEHNFPMATYLALVAVGPYKRIDGVSPNGVPLRHYTFPEVRDEFESAVTISGEAIDWMSDRFGPYPFEAYGYVSADVPGASLETQTMVLLSSGMIGQRTVIHEMAHMWFGNWVSLDSWSEMWRNEGFATYITFMWENRDDPEGLELQMAAVESAVEENVPQFPLGDPAPNQLFSFNTYFKGAVLVHALRQEMGDEAFFNGLRAYIQRYGGGGASDAQFQAVMEDAAGFSLDNFFAQWLN